jgi:Flp pilus assembly pilin Flp
MWLAVRLHHALHDEGATAVEYAIMVAAIAAVVTAVAFALGTTTHDSLQDSCGKAFNSAAC